MTMNNCGMAVLLVLVLAGPVAADDADRISEIVDNCLVSEDPGACMEAYGFRCGGNRVPEWSPEPSWHGCNIPLGDGRLHFVQISSDGTGWKVANQESYLPEVDEAVAPEEDTQEALSTFMRDAMKSYRSHSGRSGGHRDPDKQVEIQIGIRKEDENRIIRALCAMTFDSYPDEVVISEFKSDCETQLLRTIKRISQPEEAGPFRAAGRSEIEWQSRNVVLASADKAIVLDGRHVFESNQTPCQWISGCCSTDGAIYLDSCRTPTEPDKQGISSCLTQGLRPRSEEFLHCLSDQDVMVGCEDQADGSRICY